MPVPKPHLLPKSWKDTIHLPQTKFPPRASPVADREGLLKKCTDDIYAWQQSHRKGEVFTLHDGPPYANGKLHIGHALNKILKDITCRFQLSQGKRVDWVPGWDCHGLPIELRALQQLKGQASASDEACPRPLTQDALTVRRAARELAIDTMRDQEKSFRAWGLMADWDNPWRTMDKNFEVKQLEVFREMLKKGLIYRQCKPVYWSPSSRTALAEAELEYRDDHVSTAAFVKFQLDNVPAELRKGLDADAHVSALIWTTTPWTLPANRAIAVNKDLKYVVADSQIYGRLVLAESRLEDVRKICKHHLQVAGFLLGSDLVGSTYHDRFFEKESPPRSVLHADFVLADSGTGLVHIAPGHGGDDYELGLKHGIPAFAPIDDAGSFTALASPRAPAVLEGKYIITEGTQAVLRLLSDYKNVIAQHKYTHKYPFDWRSKQPVVLRATEQWFANVGDIQNAAMQALSSVRFIPEGGKARLLSFIKNRREWCISRQRAWGVPIPALYDRVTGAAILTEEVVSHIISVISKRGTDAWWSDDELDPAWTPPELRDANGQTSYKRGKDTMDVWFDSGTSWTQTRTSTQVADVYLEGTDQHRGWFQSSLLTFIASQGSAFPAKGPFRSLVTHGFTLDKHGHKMSKSIGNVVSPDEIIEGTILPPLTRKVDGQKKEFKDSMGVDALRLWTASCDYTKDIVISLASLKVVNTTLAKYRVTFKQLLGIMQDYDSSRADYRKGLDAVHKIAIWQLENVEKTVRRYYVNFEYHKAIAEINRYISQDLSAFYFEIIKDLAYCGTMQERNDVQVTCGMILFTLQHLLAPVVPLLVQETWEHTPDQIQSDHRLSPFQRTWVHTNEQRSPYALSDLERQQLQLDVPALTHALAAIQNAQEQARSAKKMGSSLQCFVVLQVESGEEKSLLTRYQASLEAIFVVSKVEIFAGSLPDRVTTADWSYRSRFNMDGKEVVVHVYAPQSSKCVRCLRYKAPMEANKEDALCQRCKGLVQELWIQRPELFEDQLAAIN